MPTYIYILCNKTYFVIFPEVAIVRWSRKYWQKDKGRIFRNVRGCNIFSGVCRVNGQFFNTILWSYSDICIFCSANQYIVSKKQLVGSAHEVSPDSSKIVLDEMSHLSPLPPGRTTSKTPLIQTHQKQLQCVSFPQF